MRVDETLGRFLDSLASATPAPSAGAAAALTGAMAAGLVAMAGRLAGGRVDDGDDRAAWADRTRSELLELGAADGEAYAAVLAAVRLPREADPEARGRQISSAWRRAAQVPLDIAERAAALAMEAADLARRGNPSLAGDARAGATLAAAAARAAATLVTINVEQGSLDAELATRAERAAHSAADAAS